MFYIGTSGWSYAHWQGVLYPPGLPSGKRLETYVRQFDTVELNSSTYQWPKDATFAGWEGRLPKGFRMSVKAPRALTHARRLKDPDAWLARIERGMANLGDKCGPLLIQLPPDFACDLAVLSGFLERLPGSLRAAFELRHASWHREEVFALLAERGAAYCVMSGAGLPCILRATAPFVYVRLHGPDPQRMYAGSYPEEDLRWWSARIQEWDRQGLDVFAYFNNDMQGYAVRNAARLKNLCGLNV